MAGFKGSMMSKAGIHQNAVTEKSKASAQNRRESQIGHPPKTGPGGCFSQYQLGYGAVTSTPKSQ